MASPLTPLTPPLLPRTSSLLALLNSHKYTGILAGTRKTTPGFRLVEKYGMLLGGADPHRHDLSSMTMLKDNHIWACAARHHPSSNGAQTKSHEAGEKEETREEITASAIHAAVAAAKSSSGFALKVEVECQSYDEADAAIAAGVDIVMLDNFTPEECLKACRALKKKWRARAKEGEIRQFLVEVSGGLNEGNVGGYLSGLSGGDGEEGDGVDIISTSSIHQGVGIVDFSLKVVH